MKNYFIYLFLLCLTGCSTTYNHLYSDNKDMFFLEAQICLKDTSEKMTSSYAFNEFTGEGIDKYHPSKLLLPFGPLQSKLIGNTFDQSLIYTQKLDSPYGLHSVIFNTEHYSFSFKRDFPMYVYTQQWSQWQYADVSEPIDNRYYLNKLKVRFRAMNYQTYRQYVSSYYKQPSLENLENCD